MDSLPKELINDIIEFNKYPHEVYKISYFAVCCEGGGIQNLKGFFQVVDDSEYDLDNHQSTIKKSFLDKILRDELPAYYDTDYREGNLQCKGMYTNFESIIYKIERIN